MSLPFRVAASAGALGFGGNDEGHGIARLWKWPFRKWWDLSEVAIFTKTISLRPMTGNLRLWCPWRAVWPIGLSSLGNRVGLTNPGLPEWLRLYSGRNLYLSIYCMNVAEAKEMALQIPYGAVRGIEVNLSCPSKALFDEKQIVETVLEYAKVPVGIKIQYGSEFLANSISELSWIHAINSIRRGDGGVSGKAIIGQARHSLEILRGCSTSIISGGGILTKEEAIYRLNNGADVIGLGTVFLLRPWRIAEIVKAALEWRA